MKNTILSLFTILLMISCGDKEDSEMMETGDCGGNLTVIVDGGSLSYGEPTSAFLVENDLAGGHELGVLWSGNSGNINFQLVIDLNGADCITPERFTLDNLPSYVSIFSLQFTSLTKATSVSNVFAEDGQSGWIEVVSCDGTNDVIDVKFEFTGLPAFGGDTPIVVTGASSENICFSRTK